jgi:hypothetical protein
MQPISTRKAGTSTATFTIEGRTYVASLFRSCEDALFSSGDCPSIFQQKEYHAALEAAPPDKMDFWYVRLDSEDRFAGMLTFQVKDFSPGDSLKNHGQGDFFKRMQYKAGRIFRFSVLCLGNTLVTGDYGFCFQPEVNPKTQTLLMMETIDWLMRQKPFRKVSLIFVKDFYDDIFKGIPESHFCQKYHAIETQPSMILNISPTWGNLAGYIRALKSKYRVRANKALQLASHLERIELNADEIEALEPVLHQLYLKVVDDVGFNLFILSEGYFTALKRSLGDRFRLWIYRDQGELISFFTVFEDGDILDAHFLGYDPAVNHQYKLYLNMLLSMIDLAASRGFRQLQLSRTATEIKSSVGAEGIHMWAYMRHRRAWFNALIPRIYSFFQPDLSWTPRMPFHES